MVLLTACACSGSHSTSTEQTKRKRLRFVATPAAFHAQCRLTARAVGYPVPCPLRVPPGFASDQDGATPGCVITIICPAAEPRRWIAGTSANATTHLIILGSPRPVSDSTRFVNSGAEVVGSRVRPLRWTTINGWRMRAVFVLAATSSAFAWHHVVLIWTVGQHTYGVGFHDLEQFACPSCAATTHGLRQTLLLDEELARHIKLVGP
jgi:hypothetical protein